MTILERDLTPDDIGSKILRNPIRVALFAEVNDAILVPLDEGGFTDREAALARVHTLDQRYPDMLFAVGPLIKPSGTALYEQRRVMMDFEYRASAVYGGLYKVNIMDGIFKQIMEAE